MPTRSAHRPARSPTTPSSGRSCATHYGIAGVTGPEMRRVAQSDPAARRGGDHGRDPHPHRHPDADQHPQRGNFILGTLLGSPPPPPPAGLPKLMAEADGKPFRTLREVAAESTAAIPNAASCWHAKTRSALGCWRSRTTMRSDAGPATQDGRQVTPPEPCAGGESWKWRRRDEEGAGGAQGGVPAHGVRIHPGLPPSAAGSSAATSACSRTCSTPRQDSAHVLGPGHPRSPPVPFTHRRRAACSAVGAGGGRAQGRRSPKGWTRPASSPAPAWRLTPSPPGPRPP